LNLTQIIITLHNSLKTNKIHLTSQQHCHLHCVMIVNHGQVLLINIGWKHESIHNKQLWQSNMGRLHWGKFN